MTTNQCPEGHLEGNTISHQVYDHKNNRFNREHIVVTAVTPPAPDGACKHYSIAAVIPAQTSDSSEQVVNQSTLDFQDGSIAEVGPNGITDQALLAVVLDRMRGFNNGPYRCRENSVIITKIEEALMWMEKRSNDRARQGIDGVRNLG